MFLSGESGGRTEHQTSRGPRGVGQSAERHELNSVRTATAQEPAHQPEGGELYYYCTSEPSAWFLQ